MDYWRARANAVFGMFRRERELTASLKEKTRDLQLQLQQAKDQQPAGAKFDPAEIFPQEARQQYGDDQLRDIAAPLLAKVNEQVAAATKPLRERIDGQKQDAAERAYQDFTDRLVALVPDALEVDKTPEWLAWLNNVDEVTGYTYLDMLKAHESRMDAQRVAQIFGKFKAQTGKAPAPAAAKPSAPMPPVAASGTGGFDGDVPQSAPALRYPSPDEIREHFKRSKLGKLTDKERQDFEARLRAPRV